MQNINILNAQFIEKINSSLVFDMRGVLNGKIFKTIKLKSYLNLIKDNYYICTIKDLNIKNEILTAKLIKVKEL